MIKTYIGYLSAESKPKDPSPTEERILEELPLGSWQFSYILWIIKQ